MTEGMTAVDDEGRGADNPERRLNGEMVRRAAQAVAVSVAASEAEEMAGELRHLVQTLDQLSIPRDAEPMRTFAAVEGGPADGD